jgi:hypothetical protein
LRKAVLQ